MLTYFILLKSHDFFPSRIQQLVLDMTIFNHLTFFFYITLADSKHMIVCGKINLCNLTFFMAHNRLIFLLLHFWIPISENQHFHKQLWHWIHATWEHIWTQTVVHLVISNDFKSLFTQEFHFKLFHTFSLKIIISKWQLVYIRYLHKNRNTYGLKLIFKSE